MTNLAIVLMSTIIGYVFGGVGALFGFVIGILIVARRTQKNSLTVTGSQNRELGNDVDIPLTSAGLRAYPARLSAPPAPMNEMYVRRYESSIIAVWAVILSYCGTTNDAIVRELTEMIQSDDWIKDKSMILDGVAEQFPRLQVERRESSILFQLHSSAIIERLVQLPKKMQSHMAMQLEYLSSDFNNSDAEVYSGFVRSAIDALRRQSPISQERVEAERFITRSGDRVAMRTLAQMRKNPARYREMLRTGARANSIMKIALGVFAGIVAADLVRAALSDTETESLSAEVDSAIEEVGGIDMMPLVDNELDAIDTVNGFDDEWASSESQSTSGKLDADQEGQLCDAGEAGSDYDETSADADIESEEVDESETEVSSVQESEIEDFEIVELDD